MSNFYHAGPAGLTELRTLRSLIDSGETSIEGAQRAWKRKWGDFVDEDVLLAHPTMDEISLTSDLDEANEIASSVEGYVVYVVDAEPHRINEEGYPVCRGPVACKAI